MLKKILYVVAALLILIQFIPVERTNPPVTHTVKWDSDTTLSFAKAACFDCHSNETKWPWYSYVAPVSWLIAHDVSEGREHLNFSTGNLREAHESSEEILKGKMPIKAYIIMHPEADLNEQDKALFTAGLDKTFAGSKEKGKHRNEHEEEEHEESH